ncbi:MAG: sugar phosphorylase [Anaerolineales bacterium]|nr:sugar phosphorylase [Anaerolineales bacterium]
MKDLERTFLDRLEILYGSERARTILPRLLEVVHRFQADDAITHPRVSEQQLSERDTILITYGDMVKQEGIPPLQTLARFAEKHLKGLISTLHILPFFPYSSDDGFSVIDYRKVNPEFGTWEDIARINQHFNLMFDAVINHISSESDWFKGFLSGDPRFADYFISVDPQTDLSSVVRPRDLPLLTPVQTSEGRRYVWTTFSADQIDLNFANPDVMLEILDLLLFYVRQGAKLIRLDAIAFLWKEIGTSCIHLPKTHHAVKLMRELFDAVAPWVLIITETNVPHEENLSYFGDGTDQAHLVYQFALPPLVLHTLQSGDASHLSAWASDLRLPSDQVTFFNFLASHDGVGLRPAQGILSEEEITMLVQRTEAGGGGISYRRVGEGDRSPYELNINYFDALAEPKTGNKAVTRSIARFLASQAIMLSLVGVPGIYFHSLFGSRNYPEGVERSGHLRAINREKLTLQALEADLAQPDSLRARVFEGYSRMLSTRASQPAFHPHGEQQILDLGPYVFTVLRLSPNQGRRVLCVHEVSGRRQRLDVHLPIGSQYKPIDLLTGETVSLDACQLTPYQVRWINLDKGIKNENRTTSL